MLFTKSHTRLYDNMAFSKDRTDMLARDIEDSAFDALDAAIVNCRDRDIRRSQDVSAALETLRALNICEKHILRFRRALDDETPVGRVYRAKAALRALKALRGREG